VVREREHCVAAATRGRISCLALAAAQQDRVAGEQHRRQERLGGEHLPISSSTTTASA
jgi:hypothetical protein